MALPALHPIAEIWPLLPDDALDQLAEDIRANGQILPIIRVGGLLLDGRNRWLACERIGVDPWVEDAETDDPDALAWSLNEHRRHADEGVRALAAARRADMRQGERTDLSPFGERLSQAKAAERFGVSKRSVERAKTVLNHGSPELVAAVESGDIAVSLAAKTVRHYRETGEPITSIADLKRTMRRIYREENPLEAPSPAANREPPAPAPDHAGVDTFAVVRGVIHHAEQYSAADAAARIDKWTRLNILDDLPPAIDYLKTLEECLTKGGKP